MFVYNGLGMEPWADQAIQAADNSKLKTVNLSSHITPIPLVDPEERKEHGAYDPHVWMGLSEAKAEALAVKNELQSVSPENREYFEHNYRQFAAETDALKKEYQQKFSHAPRKELVTGHTAFAYLCRDFGLTQISVEDAFASGEPSAKRLVELADFCKAHHVKVVFTEELVSPAAVSYTHLLVYYISVTTVGGWATDWTNDVFFGEIVNDAATSFLASIQAPDWLSGLIVDGIIGGVGTVLGFVPQILLIFFFMSLLEDSGYMARVAFIMDRIFRRFGLSGKSFIPILVGMGCGVPAVMATRTIENERDRRMTIMLCTFIPCSAKAVIISMITSTFFPDSIFLAPAMYFLGIAVIVLSGIALKKTHLFSGDPAPFVMELPAYHIPSMKGVLIHMWERARGFIIKAGTIIFTACVIIWFFSTFNAHLEMVDIENSMMAFFGNAISWVFAPLGLGSWKGAVAVISAEMAKENAIGTLAVLNGITSDADEAVMAGIAGMFTPLAAMSYMILNLFDPPCVVAMATIAREMGDRKWAAVAILFQVAIGYSMALVTYQLGGWLFYGMPFGLGQGVAIVLCLAALYFILRPAPHDKASNETREEAAA